MQQLVLDLLPAPAPSFDNYVPGRNAEALAALQAWLDGKTQSTTCLLLWGEARSGRSHLLCAALAGQAVEPARAVTTAARQTTALAVDGAASPDLADLDDLPEGIVLLAADNVDALDDIGQVRLFNAFNRLKMRGGRLLVAASQPPAALAVREDLRTRLGSGLIYRLTPLSDREKVTALAARAARLGLALPDGALDYLLGHAPRDMASLTAILDALNRFTLEHKRPVTLPLLRTLIRGDVAASTTSPTASTTASTGTGCPTPTGSA